ncbi:MAG: hypothetical protein JNK79_09925 [Chitinophagaceae bacterium]|nr:hypothetical protein [Chitinophagaceae bacterium]
MTYDEFIKSLAAEQPPSRLSDELKALWYDGKENWETSHNIAQDIADRNGSWIHAYLHRKEGDLFNARYWYSKAGKSEPAGMSLKEEWEALVKNFIRLA